MRNFTLLSFLLSIIFAAVSLFSNDVFAQTTGLIYKPAVNGGNNVFDPNGDGYISRSTAGFSAPNDEGTTNSEIPYRPFPIMANEVIGDIITGSNGGHTDFVPSLSAGSTGSPIAAYFDGKNLMFRVRIGRHSTASKGYSIMIDSDGLYGNLVSGKTPSKTPNPGFEFEISLATNFDVSIYDHRNQPDGGTRVWTGSVDQYSQKAIAASTASNDADYFYEFYVPLTAFSSGITANTRLRMSGITVTSAQSGITGTVSDVGGINFSGTYNGDARNAWFDVISTFPGVTLNELMNGGFPSTVILPKPPVVTAPIKASDVSISGTSTEPAGSSVRVFRTVGTASPVQLGTTTVNSNGTWTLSGISTVLNGGDNITATVTTSGVTSVHSQPVTVISSARMCTTTTAPTITGTNNGNIKSLQGTSPHNGTHSIRLYRIDPNTGVATLHASYVTPSTYAAGTTWDTGVALEQGMWAVTATPSGMCESPRSNEICYNGNGSSTFNNAPNIILSRVTYKDSRPGTNSDIVASNLNTIHGNFETAPSSATQIYLYVNGVRQESYSVSASSTAEWTINVSGFTFREGDFISVRAVELNSKNGNYTCGSLASKASNFKTVSTQTTPPTITGTYCGTTQEISGTSVEPQGTTIRLYNGSTLLGSTTVNSFGVWRVTGLNISSGTITARATAVNKLESIPSNAVTIGTNYAGNTPAITGPNPIFEGGTAIYGTAPASSFVVLYINGEPYVDQYGEVINAIASSSGNWSIDNISPFELYAGATLTVKARASATSTCESAPSAPVTVACREANTNIRATFSAPKYCPGTPAIINLSTSENGVIYNVYRKKSDGSLEPFGSSILGTGKALSLISAPVSTTGTVLLVRTIKVGASCQYTIGGEMTVELYPEVPRNFTVTATPESSSCPNVSVTITLEKAEAGYSYQLINNATKANIGDLIIPTVEQDGQDIVFDPIIVTKTTEYGVVIKGVVSGCVAENTILKTITITGGPDVERAVTVDKNKICVNTSAVISVQTENIYTYKLYEQGNPDKLITTFTGTGGTVNTTVSEPFKTVGTKTFYVTVTGGGCSDLKLTTTVTVEVTDGINYTVSAGNNRTICGNTTAVLDGSDPTPGSGLWTTTSKPTGAADPVFANSTLPNTEVSGLVQGGTYEFTWTVTSACSGIVKSATVRITLNCASEFSVKTNKFVEEYMNGEKLVTMSDVDGGITAASVISGVIPPGTSLNTLTGELIVSDRTKLTAGNFVYNVRTTDARNVATNSEVILRMYSSNSAPAPAPFPVELATFTALYANQKVYLQWITASELDNDRFEIERSINGKDFTKIGTVKGKGTTTKTTRYTFEDAQVMQGSTFYRLRQVDFNGKFSYSKIVEVTIENAPKVTVQAYPNPFSGTLNVVIALEKAGEVELKILDINGRVVYTEKPILDKGFQELNLPLNNLRHGMYLLRVTGAGTNQTLKVMKAH